MSTRPVNVNGRGLTPAEADAEIDYWELRVHVIQDIPVSYRKWRKLVLQHNVSGKPAHDARLVATMLVHGLTHIVTFNGQDFARYPFITVIDPRTV